MRRSQSPAEIQLEPDVFAWKKKKMEEKTIIICVGVHMLTANDVSTHPIFLFRVFSTTDEGASTVFSCTECASFLFFSLFLHHGSPPMCPLLMAFLVIEFDAAHLQANKRAVCKRKAHRQKRKTLNSPNSPIQSYWYFSGCIIKLDNPLRLEAKWWNSFQWPQLNHKQKALWSLCMFRSVS